VLEQMMGLLSGLVARVSTLEGGGHDSTPKPGAAHAKAVAPPAALPAAAPEPRAAAPPPPPPSQGKAGGASGSPPTPQRKPAPASVAKFDDDEVARLWYEDQYRVQRQAAPWAPPPDDADRSPSPPLAESRHGGRASVYGDAHMPETFSASGHVVTYALPGAYNAGAYTLKGLDHILDSGVAPWPNTAAPTRQGRDEARLAALLPLAEVDSHAERGISFSLSEWSAASNSRLMRGSHGLSELTSSVSTRAFAVRHTTDVNVAKAADKLGIQVTSFAFLVTSLHIIALLVASNEDELEKVQVSTASMSAASAFAGLSETLPPAGHPGEPEAVKHVEQQRARILKLVRDLNLTDEQATKAGAAAKLARQFLGERSDYMSVVAVHFKETYFALSGDKEGMSQPFPAYPDFVMVNMAMAATLRHYKQQWNDHAAAAKHNPNEWTVVSPKGKNAPAPAPAPSPASPARAGKPSGGGGGNVAAAAVAAVDADTPTTQPCAFGVGCHALQAELAGMPGRVCRRAHTVVERTGATKIVDDWCTANPGKKRTEFEPDLSNTKCQKCKKSGHYTTTCPEKKKNHKKDEP
jgi:hypothetical protein